MSPHDAHSAGGQEVHVIITESEVQLTPATVRAGDVYLVLESSASGGLFFVQAKRSSAATPGPLSAEDLARLAAGSSQWTAIESVEDVNCDPQQNAEARGQMGHCGNVVKFTLSPGLYAILADAPERVPRSANGSARGSALICRRSSRLGWIGIRESSPVLCRA